MYNNSGIISVLFIPRKNETEKKMKKDITEDLKNSARTVLREKRRFLPFFLVAFIIEALFISLFMIGHSVNELYRAVITEKYDYHYIIEGLTGDDYANVINKTMSTKPLDSRQIENITHEIYKLGSETYHRLYVTLKDTDSSTVNAFLRDIDPSTSKDSDNKYSGRFDLEEEEEIKYSYSPTPLMRLSEYIFKNNLLVVLLWAAVLLISIFLLVCVYNVRISHYRFMYGIYMTCGADLRKLVVGALCEMLVVFAVMLAPAYIFSCVTVTLMFKGTGMGVVYLSPILLLAVLSALAVLCVAVIFPMKKISDSMPIELITKSGTSEYVRSPKSTAKGFMKNFPVFYELLSVRRFAKYYASLLMMCIVFNSLFVVGIYAGQLTEAIRNTREGTFKITASELGDDVLSEIVNVEGLDYAMWEVSRSAASELTFLEMDAADSSRAGIHTVSTYDGKNATIDFDIEGFNRAKLEMLASKGLARVTGDIDLLYSRDGEKYAVVSRDVNGIDTYDIEVGDKVTLCVVTVNEGESFKEYVFGATMTSTEILSKLLEDEQNGEIVYTRYELEVCAVIDYEEPKADMILGVSPEMYEKVSGVGSYNVTSVDVYMSEDATDAEENKAYNSLSKIVCMSEGWSIVRTYASFTLGMVSNTYMMGMFVTVAVFVLCAVPVLWLFSQKVFYEKREDEVTLLYRMGAGEKRLCGMFLTGGAFVAVVSFIFSVVMSFLISVALLTIVAWILPFFGFKYSWMLTFDFDIWTLLLSAAVCTVCGLLASLTAYLRGAKKRRDIEAGYLTDGKTYAERKGKRG